MRYVCDAPPHTWFQIETEAEACIESRDMGHAVERHFRMEWDEASRSYVPPPSLHVVEQNIGLKAHIERTMPMFLTLRDNAGKGLVTAMLPSAGREDLSFRPIVVGFENSDPYDEFRPQIRALADHFGLRLNRSRCYPYGRNR
ncbi:MAG: hypothetical protein RLZ98_26 [Pseudomonadota bacterium]|jgi:hypothetical protein